MASWARSAAAGADHGRPVMLTRLLALVATLTLALAGAAPAMAQGGPIKIGLLTPLTGAASALGKDMLGGTELYLDEIGRQVAGRKIELIVEDTEGVTATALTKARKLVDQDRVHILTGGLLASTGYAIHPFADGAKLPTTYPVMSSDDLTQRKPAKSVLPQMGDEALGVHTALHYSAALDNPANQKFAKAFEAKMSKVPSYYGETCYTNARWIVEAIKAINGKVEDREAFLAALRKVELKDFPRGPVVIDRWGNPIQNIYVRKVERVGGHLQNS